MASSSQIADLLTALRVRFLSPSVDGAAAVERARVGDLLQTLTQPPQPSHGSDHGVTGHLPLALALLAETAPELHPVLAPIADHLPWRYSYQPRTDAPGLESNMAWAELIGPPQSLLHSDQVCFGLTLIGPHTHYPAHRHPAVELYHVLTGHAEWSLNGHSVRQPPGALILHPGNAVHAMTTSEEPLLAIYSWTGDVHTLSSFCLPE